MISSKDMEAVTKSSEVQAMIGFMVDSEIGVIKSLVVLVTITL